jgi:thiamine-monophosphate kinase
MSHRPSKPTPTPTSEFSFIEQLKRRAGGSASPDSISRLVQGIGDDAAVIHQDEKTDLLISADLLVERIDFYLNWTNPNWLGQKALAVSLSDVAAMGGTPRWGMVSIGLPESLWDSGFAEAFYDGWFEVAAQAGVSLIGGDTSRTPDAVVVDSIVLGEVAAGQAVLRGGARPGDLIYVTGELGGAAGGLRLLQISELATAERSAAASDALLARQLRPQARIRWGEYLGRERLATAMIDVSDGISSDLHHLCAASGVGASIAASHLPVDRNLQGFPSGTALELALHGGEDYELLFTVSPANAERLPRELDGVPITLIGQITEPERKLTIDLGDGPVELKPHGFEHFR